MALNPKVQGLAAASMAIGIALIVCSSLVIDQMRPGLEFCHNLQTPSYLDEFCDLLKYWIAAGSFGIIASIIQFVSMLLVLMDKTNLWSGLHIVICILCLVSFGNAVAKKGFNTIATSKVKAFTAIALIDVVFSIIAAIVMNKL